MIPIVEEIREAKRKAGIDAYCQCYGIDGTVYLFAHPEDVNAAPDEAAIGHWQIKDDRIIGDLCDENVIDEMI